MNIVYALTVRNKAHRLLFTQYVISGKLVGDVDGWQNINQVKKWKKEEVKKVF